MNSRVTSSSCSTTVSCAGVSTVCWWMGRVRAVRKDIALLLLVDRLLGDAKALGKDTGCLVAGRDLGAHGRRATDVLAQSYPHGFALRVVCKDPRNFCTIDQAMKSG